jgi:hypothetical protein
VSSTPALSVQTWLDLAAENRGTPRFELSYAVFQAVLEGIALTKSELASRVSMDRGEALELIEELIDKMVDEGRLRTGEDHHLVAAGGLSLEDSPHTIIMNGRRFGVWCALDAVGIPAGLEMDASIESTCIDTGEPVRIEIQQGRVAKHVPADLFISLVPASVATSVFDTL